MNKKSLVVMGALAGVLALGTSVGVSNAFAEGENGKVKCKGVAKAGENDCGANGHSCGGKATKDYDANEWKYVESDEACKTMQERVKKERATK